MSLRAITWAWSISGVSAPQKLVLLRLADTANDDGSEAWRTTARMVEETGLSRRAVQGALRGLEAAGLIAVARAANAGRKLTTVYQLPVADRHLQNEVEERPTGAGDAPLQAQEVRPSGLTGAGYAPVGAQEMRRTGAGDAPSPYYLHPISPIERERAQASLLEEGGSPKPTRPVRATRISSDWWPSQADWEFAAREGMSDNAIDREAARFRDHWLAKSGRDAAKADWSATWRNWIRRAHEFRPGGHGSKPASHIDQVGEVFEHIRRGQEVQS